jgi:CAAX prenyl protease-like protein
MFNFSLFLAFLAAALVMCVLWGRALWFFSDQWRGFNSCVLFVMNYTSREYREVRAILLSLIYYLCGLVAAFVLWAMFAFGHPVGIGLSLAHVPLIALGIIGEISLSSLIVSLYFAVAPNTPTDRLEQLRNIPWIRGVMDLPPRLAPVSAALGGVVEELLFRGVALPILIQELGMPPFPAIAVAGALFLFQQLLQVQTQFQMIMIGAGCVAISLVGGVLVVSSGSVVPALLCHASFVVFFLDTRQSAR